VSGSWYELSTHRARGAHGRLTDVPSPTHQPLRAAHARPGDRASLRVRRAETVSRSGSRLDGRLLSQSARLQRGLDLSPHRSRPGGSPIPRPSRAHRRRLAPPEHAADAGAAPDRRELAGPRRRGRRPNPPRGGRPRRTLPNPAPAQTPPRGPRHAGGGTGRDGGGGLTGRSGRPVGEPRRPLRYVRRPRRAPRRPRRRTGRPRPRAGRPHWRGWRPGRRAGHPCGRPLPGARSARS
jgi:hypothetical protein